MMLPLLVGAALARPPQLALAIGGAMGGGESSLGSYFTAAPATAVSVNWSLGPLQSWVGLSGSLLMAGVGEDVIPSSLLQAEIGVGGGGPGGGGGIYGGSGFPGPIVGIYGDGTAPGPGWMRRIGLEGRAFYTSATDSSGLALLLRVEPGRPDRARPERRPPPPRRGPPPYPPPPPYVGAPPPPRAAEERPAEAAEERPVEAAEAPPGEGEGVVIPVGSAASVEAPPSPPPPPSTPPAEPATEEEPPARHHDEPY